jgi:MFS family permease
LLQIVDCITPERQLKNMFKKPPGYVIASVLCSLGGFLFGHDTGIIGPVTVMEDFTKYVGNSSPTIHGLIVSSILIPAAISSFFAGKLADRLGRTRGIAIGSFIFGLGAAIEAASVHIGMFVVGRVVAGVGEGLYLGTLVVYVCMFIPSYMPLADEMQIHLRDIAFQTSRSSRNWSSTPHHHRPGNRLLHMLWHHQH